MIEENVKRLLEELSKGNCFGEKVSLVAATKTRTAEEIRRAVKAGVPAVGENRVQEFREKYDEILGAERHFIGRLQTNKVKYLVGKADLIHSVDSDALAEEIALRAKKLSAVQNILIEVNLGEENKGGFPLDTAEEAYLRLREKEGLKVCGFMAMLPLLPNEQRDAELCRRMRALFEKARRGDEAIRYLSMGMSGDWKFCVAHGSNMVRIGTAIFGERNVAAKP